MFRLGPFICIFLLVLSPAFSRQDVLMCGTYPDRWKEELHLHRHARNARTRSLAAAASPLPTTNRDIGNIAVLEDSDGIVSRRNEFNLDHRTLTFVPSAANATRYKFQIGPDTYDSVAASAGTPIALGDDDFRQVELPFAFPFFGNSYSRLFVNSDGNATFEAGDKASSDRSLGRIAAGPPRIAVLFMDLDPSNTPHAITFLTERDRVVVSWTEVPQFKDFGGGLPQTFQMRLFAGGRIEFAYSGVHTAGASVGIAPGRLQGSTSVISFLTGGGGEFSAAVAERFGGATEVDFVTAAQKFYETHDDAYDYLVFYNTLDIPAADGIVAWESTVRNHRSGYGDQQVDIGKEFGSASRLQAIMNMGPLSQFPKDPKAFVPARQTARDTSITVLAHEAGHLFLAYASIRDSRGPRNRPMLGYQNFHWAFVFNSEASLLEGERIRDDGPGVSPRFTTSAATEAYAPLDQYLMGFRAPEEVPPTFLVTGEKADSMAFQHPQVGASFDGSRRDIQLDEIIQAEGRRTPDHTVAQRHFRFAFIVIVAQGSVPTPAELGQLETYRGLFETFYRQASSDRAYADASLRRGLHLSVFPAAGVVQGRSAQATLSIEKPAAGALSVFLRTQTGAASMPRFVTIPAGGTSAGFTITGVRQGVEEFSAEPVDSAYESEYARLQVSSAADVKLVRVEPDKGMAAGNPIIVRATDINDLPYPGARIQAVPSSGAVSPTVATADDQGFAAFQWTPGSGATAELRVFLEEAPESSGLVIRAPNSNAAHISAVVNAASFTSSLSPGALGTIYGKNLAGDTRVMMNDRSCPLLYVSDGQINFQVPPELPTGAAKLVVSNTQGASEPAAVTLAGVAPGVFFDPATGFGAPAAQRGSTVDIYCTGLAAETDSVQVFLTPLPITVEFVRRVPASAGLYQVRIRISDDTPAGTQLLFLIANGVRSNQVKIAVE